MYSNEGENDGTLNPFEETHKVHTCVSHALKTSVMPRNILLHDQIVLFETPIDTKQLLKQYASS